MAGSHKRVELFVSAPACACSGEGLEPMPTMKAMTSVTEK
jgi:hypothetical protein